MIHYFQVQRIFELFSLPGTGYRALNHLSFAQTFEKNTEKFPSKTQGNLNKMRTIYDFGENFFLSHWHGYYD